MDTKTENPSNQPELKDEQVYNTKALIAIEHFSHGKTVRQIAETLGVSERTIQRYIKNYNALGMESLLKKKIPGRSKKLNAEQLLLIKKVVNACPSHAGYIVLDWSPTILMHYIIDEFDILLSKEKCRQLLKALIDPTDLSKPNLKNEYKRWLNDPDTAIWIYGHLYLGTQNRDAKFKSGKIPYIDDDLLKTQKEIFEGKIDLSNKARPQLAICMINIKTNQIGCKMLEQHQDVTKQVQNLFSVALNQSSEHNVVVLTTRSSITKKNIECMRYHTNSNINTSLIFFPSSSPVYDRLTNIKNNIIEHFNLLETTRSSFKSSRMKEFKKTTRDKIKQYLDDISTF